MKNQLEKISSKANFAFWPIEFAEIFSEKGGFDIVIANPPYVRQENISDPLAYQELNVEEKRVYKQKLQEQIKKDWSFNGRSLISKIDGRADLYVYFYLKGLKLLNEDGVMCFISSNSWLDVGYGGDLQEILLKYVPIVAIYDNQVKRSFKNADVNTIIALLKAPFKKEWDNNLKDNIVRFVNFKKPFEEVIFSDVFLEIEKTNERKITENFKIYPIKQYELYNEGLEKEEGQMYASYVGNKWGGIYLRAPEIFFKILEKGKDKLVRLGDIAEVKRGFTTGANEFFYLEPTGQPAPKGLLYVKNSAGWEGYIEEEFLKPVIKSPKELKTIIVKEEDLKYKVFMCHKSKEELQGTYTLEYIEWGEKQGCHKRPTCTSRQRWWELPYLKSSSFIFKKGYGDFFAQFLVESRNIFIDQTFYYWECEDPEIWSIYLNSSFFIMFLKISTSTGLGEGLLRPTTFEIENIVLPQPEPIELRYLKTNGFLTRPIKSIFEELGFPKCTQKNCNHPEHPYEYVKPDEVSFDSIMPDRRELDRIIFEAIGLTEEEQLEVYRTVVKLVKNRLLKAKKV